ncbi:hypothetical protein V2J09_003713 [Rumex salicifolius]
MAVKQRKSLCEESMLLILNILKFSSLSLARNTLPVATSSSAGDPPPPKRPAGRTNSRRKAQLAPEAESKLSYVMLPTGRGDSPSSAVVIHHHQGTRGRGRSDADGRFADYIRRFHEKTENEVQNAVVECKSSDYIKRFHEKIRKDSNNDSKRLVLPPRLHLYPQNYHS